LCNAATVSPTASLPMNKQLLLVEDDDAIAGAIRLHVEQAGFKMHRESDGRLGIAAIDRQPWDLVLLDLMLPSVDGWDVCKHLRASRPQTPVIMLSARASETYRILGLELGADDYLAKPFSMFELIARIRAVLRRLAVSNDAGTTPKVLRHGLLLLKVERRELWRNDKLITLTQREFDLLHFFIRHPGQTFTRSQLLENVWGTAFDGFEHTVNSHINRLRSKIETDVKEPTALVTVWGQGYRLEPVSQLAV
jgi:DNA-binding response OmpR family regulator